MSIKSILKVASITLTLGLTSAAHADFQGQLDQIYNGMSNYSAPGAFETQRRGGYFGGRYTYKTEVWDQNLVSFVAPSAKGGCNGIDAFGGSFSFVSADELVELFRSVAAAAPGYAFQIALDQMCPGCSKWMNELQSKIQAMNARLGNSCELAQGILADGADLLNLDRKFDSQYSLETTSTGLFDDFMEVSRHIGTAPTAFARVEETRDANSGHPSVQKFEKESGNIVYKALVKQSAQNWFKDGGDTSLIVEMMSMTGSVVIGDIVASSDGDKRPDIRILPGGRLTLTDFVEGRTGVSIYQCPTSDPDKTCRISSSDVATKDIEGLEEKLTDVLLNTGGVIDAFRNGQLNLTLTDEQKSVLSSLPHSIGGKIFALAHNAQAAEDMLRNSLKPIAIEYAYTMAKNAFRAVEVAMASDESVYKQQALDEIRRSKAVIDAEYESLLVKYGSVREVEEHYRFLVDNAPKPTYINTAAR